MLAKPKAAAAGVLLALTAVAVGTALAISLRRFSHQGEAADALSAPPPLPAMSGTLTKAVDPKAVFQRAFWRRPAEDDQILHAERREWTDGGNGNGNGGGSEITHWQWFLAIRPGTAFTAWLKESNPFGLQPRGEAVSFHTYASVPVWFPESAAPDTYEIHQAAGGHMTLLFSRQQNLLYATDAGQGFQKSAQ